MAGKKARPYQDRVLAKDLSFERALHRWPKWLKSVANGRTTLQAPQARSSVVDMLNVARRALAEIKFPPCLLLEVYWLCCVFVDYETADGIYYFDKLVLPDWFPSQWSDKGCRFDFKGKRIYPPQVWDEADRKFWFEKTPAICYAHLTPEQKAAQYRDYCARWESDFEISWGVLVLPHDHEVRKYIKKGRPEEMWPDGAWWNDALTHNPNLSSSGHRC